MSRFKECILEVVLVQGDLLSQRVDVIVNAWNRNFIPWWLLLPQGVAGAIRKRAGTQPFRELSKVGVMSVGQAVLTSAGRLPFRGIIHVAGINAMWRATERSIRLSTRNAVNLAASSGLKSIALPLIGAGTGGFGPDGSRRLMIDELASVSAPCEVTIVEYSR